MDVSRTKKHQKNHKILIISSLVVGTLGVVISHYVWLPAVQTIVYYTFLTYDQSAVLITGLTAIFVAACSTMIILRLFPVMSYGKDRPEALVFFEHVICYLTGEIIHYFIFS